MLYRALLHTDMPDLSKKSIGEETSTDFQFDEAEGYAFNTLVAAGQKHLLDRRSLEPVILNLFGVASEALAGAIEAQSHPESGIADVTRLLHEGIDIRLGKDADLTIRVQ